MNPPNYEYDLQYYNSVKDDPLYESVKEYWDFMGMVSIQDVQRKFNLAAGTVLKYLHAYKFEKTIKELTEQNKLMYDTSMAIDHEFGLSYKYANDILKLKEQVKLLDTALEMAGEWIDLDNSNGCPQQYKDYGCPFGECKFADGKPHENDCWKKAFIKNAEKHLRGNQ